MEDKLLEFHKVQLQLGELYNKQKCLKILLNSLYGSFSFLNFRYYSYGSASSITHTGQIVIKTVGKRISEYLTEITGIKYDWWKLSDTDSTYFELEPLIEKFNLKNIDEIDQWIKDNLEPKIEEVLNDVYDYMNHFESILEMKREVISDIGFTLTKKKRYVLRELDSEGVRFKHPELKVVGLELIRASTPVGLKKYLEKSVDIILEENPKKLVEYKDYVWEEYQKMEIEEICLNSSVSFIEKYRNVERLPPINTQAALSFNDYIKRINNNNYAPIIEGSKIKYFIMNEMNPWNYKVFGFEDYCDRSFEVLKYIDKSAMFERTFVSYLRNIVEDFHWDLNNTNTLEDLL